MICPICGAEEIKFFCRKDGYDLHRCLKCGLVFVSPLPENLGRIYGRDYYENTGKNKKFGYVDYEKDKEPMKRVFLESLRKMERLAPVKKIFDVGAATGYFLDLAEREGWRTQGSEISAYAAEMAGRKGHEVVCDEIKNIQLEERVGLVTMWDVLEHAREPVDFLRSANRLLVDRGVLLINTVDRGSLWARFWGKRWHALIPPEHLYFYSLKNLTIALSRAGFKIIEVKKIGKKFSLAYVFKILYNWQNLVLWQKLSAFFDRPPLRKLSLPVNLRDNIYVVAEKTNEI